MRFRRSSSAHASINRIRASRAFTLLEIMVVIGLIGVLTTVLVVGGTQVTATRASTPEDVFWLAVGEVRQAALLHEVDITVSYDEDEQVLLARSVMGEQRMPVPGEMEVNLTFLGAVPGGPTIMIGGQLIEAEELENVSFYGDGTCQAFRVRLDQPGKQPVMLEIDPWTCAPVLRDEEVRW